MKQVVRYFPFLLLAVSTVIGETFIVRKTKELVVPAQDVYLQTWHALLEETIASVQQMGKYTAQLAQLQKEGMEVVKTCLDGQVNVDQQLQSEVQTLTNELQKKRREIKKVTEKIEAVLKKVSKKERCGTGTRVTS